jgi:hypothetical protein
MTTIDYASPPRRPAFPVRALAGPSLVVLALAGLLAFAWLQFEISNEQRWLATHPSPPAAPAWRIAEDGATVRDVSVRRALFTVRVQQVYDHKYDDPTGRPPRNARVEYRPAFWLIVAVFGSILAVNVAVLLQRLVKDERADGQHSRVGEVGRGAEPERI